MGGDLWLWEHTLRVTRLARMLATIIDTGLEPPDRTVLTVAALYHEAGWAVEVRDQNLDPARVLARPTSDLQREVAAVTLKSAAAEILDEQTLRLAAEAIRQCNHRSTQLPEAQVLSDATNLADIGLMYILRQFRQLPAAGTPLVQLLRNWRRYVEYKYWDARINDCLRFDVTRELARNRLADAERLMTTLGNEIDANDLATHLLEQGIEAPPAMALDDEISPTAPELAAPNPK